MTPEQHSERPRDTLDRVSERVDRLELLDIDRNLLRSERLMTIIEDKLEAHGIHKSQVQALRKEVEDSGGTFDIFTELRRLYDEDTMNAVRDEVLGEAGHRSQFAYDDENCLFYPGAREVISRQTPHGIRRAFVTRGGNETQLLKLDIIGVDLEEELHAIVPLDHHEAKAEMCVSSYREGTGDFLFRWLHKGDPRRHELEDTLVDIQADSVTIIDDKATELIALGALPNNKAIGFWHRTGDGKKSQELGEGEVLPVNVFEICSLYEVGQFLPRLGSIALGATAQWTTTNRLDVPEAA